MSLLTLLASATFAFAAVYTKSDTKQYSATIKHGLESEKSGDFKTAHQAFQQAAQMKPELATPRYHLGIVAKQMGRIDEATAHFKMCLRLDPKNAECRAQMAKLERKTKLK